jgi:hypothetical protein
MNPVRTVAMRDAAFAYCGHVSMSPVSLRLSEWNPMRTSNLMAAGSVLLVICSSLSGAQPLDGPGRMLAESEWGRLAIVEGRIRLTDTCGGQESRMTAGDPESSDGEQLLINTETPESAFLSYVYVGSGESWTVFVRRPGFARIVRVRKGESPMRVCYLQHATGDCELTVDEGQRVRKFTAPDFWQLVIENPQVAQQHLLPVLAQFRSDWMLRTQLRQLERELVALASSPDYPSSKRLQALVDELRSPEFAARQKADRQLRALGHIAVGYIQRLDLSILDGEQRVRLQRLLDEFGTGQPDTPPRTAAWLAAEPRTWVALLDREDPEARQVASRHLAVLTRQNLDFDPLAGADVRQRQLRYLRLRLGIDQPLMAGAGGDTSLR